MLNNCLHSLNCTIRPVRRQFFGAKNNNENWLVLAHKFSALLLLLIGLPRGICCYDSLEKESSFGK